MSDMLDYCFVVNALRRRVTVADAAEAILAMIYEGVRGVLLSSPASQVQTIDALKYLIWTYPVVLAVFEQARSLVR